MTLPRVPDDCSKLAIPLMAKLLTQCFLFGPGEAVEAADSASRLLKAWVDLDEAGAELMSACLEEERQGLSLQEQFVIGYRLSATLEKFKEAGL